MSAASPRSVFLCVAHFVGPQDGDKDGQRIRRVGLMLAADKDESATGFTDAGLADNPGAVLIGHVEVTPVPESFIREAAGELGLVQPFAKRPLNRHERRKEAVETRRAARR